MSFVIAIAGGSGSGKTTIAERVAQRLAAPLIAEDDYYFCRTTFPAFDEDTHDFDAPEAKDHALLQAHLALARRGEAFAKPLYDFTEHARRGESATVAPGRFLVLEGLHAFAAPSLRAVIDLAVYIDAPEALRFARRLARDTAVRGRSEAFVHAQFQRTVQPAHAASVEPQKAIADLVIEIRAADDFSHADAHAAQIEAEARRRLGA